MSCFSFTQSNFWLGRFVFPLQTTWYCLENFRFFFSSKNYSFEYTWETKQLKTRIRSVITSIELGPFSSPEVELPLVSTKNHDLSECPNFWACAENLFRILSQSDLSDFTLSMRRGREVHNSRCWTFPEVPILRADQMERDLWAREWNGAKKPPKLKKSIVAGLREGQCKW